MVEKKPTLYDLKQSKDLKYQLNEIVMHIKHRVIVPERPGFDAFSRNLLILFTGTLGTGKTMAAKFIALQLKLDLYKIDLSSIVSKYIGETEKNLDKIFDEAASSNSILFFDEADAIFSKRTEIKDSHERYSNIDTDYFHQKLEEHRGIIILSTNSVKNMDDVFSLRIKYRVDFSIKRPENS